MTTTAPETTPHDVNHDVSQALRIEMARRRMTAVELAGAVGMTKSTMSRRMSGQAPWQLDEAVALARFLGVTVDALVAAPAAASAPTS